MPAGHGKVTLNSSNGVELDVWLSGDLFHVTPAEDGAETQMCLGVDLFEVIAELGGLDLESPDQAEEATRLADQAQRTLG
jgi:hypothetical protein